MDRYYKLEAQFTRENGYNPDKFDFVKLLSDALVIRSKKDGRKVYIRR